MNGPGFAMQVWTFALGEGLDSLAADGTRVSPAPQTTPYSNTGVSMIFLRGVFFVWKPNFSGKAAWDRKRKKDIHSFVLSHIPLTPILVPYLTTEEPV